MEGGSASNVRPKCPRYCRCIFVARAINYEKILGKYRSAVMRIINHCVTLRFVHVHHLIITQIYNIYNSLLSSLSFSLPDSNYTHCVLLD